MTATEPDIGNDPAGGLRPGVLADAGVSGREKGDALATETAEDQAAAREGWSVKVVTGRGERKVSGSYYTPGFITRFMVKQTVGPLLDAALAKAAPKGAAAQVQAVLDLNILDCAMRSGHFPVEAVEYLVRRFGRGRRAAGRSPTGRRVRRADLEADWKDGTASYLKRRAAQSVLPPARFPVAMVIQVRERPVLRRRRQPER